MIKTRLKLSDSTAFAAGGLNRQLRQVTTGRIEKTLSDVAAPIVKTHELTNPETATERFTPCKLVGAYCWIGSWVVLARDKLDRKSCPALRRRSMKKRVLFPVTLLAGGAFMVWTSAPALLAETRVALVAQANDEAIPSTDDPMDHDERVELIQQIRKQMKDSGLSTGIADELLKLENAVDGAEEMEDVEPELRSLGRQVNEDLKSLASTIGSLDQSIRIPGIRYGRSGTAGTRYIDADAKTAADRQAPRPPDAPAEDDSQ